MMLYSCSVAPVRMAVSTIDNGFHGDDLKLLLALFAVMVSTGAVDRGPGSVARPANRCQTPEA